MIRVLFAVSVCQVTTSISILFNLFISLKNENKMNSIHTSLNAAKQEKKQKAEEMIKKDCRRLEIDIKL